MSVEKQDELSVTGEFMPDPNRCKFMVNRPILEEWTVLFKSPDDSMGSPVADALFAVEGITQVRISRNTITLTKNVTTPWPEMAKDILPAIKQALLSDQPPVSEAALEAVQAAPADGMADAIEQLLAQHINPALAMHGGYVALVKVDDRDVYIEMGGGCQGCAASKMTMKHGVENAIREVCPQVREVFDVTDHTAGANPFYSK